MKEYPQVAAEIRRIREKSSFVEVNGNPCVVTYQVPRDAEIFICGFYHGEEAWDHRCVDEQIKALKRIGYNPTLYQAATVSLKP